MPTTNTSAHIRGIAFGAAILTLFGLAWCLASLLNWPSHPHWTIVLALGIAASLIAASAFRIVCPGGATAPDATRAAADGRRAGILFGIIFTLEGAFIALAAVLLSRHQLTDWIPVAAALIVGVHFLPLAHVFRVPLYYATGVLSILAAVVCFAIRDPASRVFWLGLSMAAILWLSASAALLQTRPPA